MVRMSHSIWREDIPRGTNPLRFFLFACRPHRTVAMLSIVAVVVASTIASLVPYLFKRIVNAVTQLPDPHAYTTIAVAALLYVLASFASQMIWRVSGFIGARWITGLRATIRQALTSYVTLHSNAYFTRKFAGSLANKISHASKGGTDMVEIGLWQFLELIIAAITSFILLFAASKMVALIFLVWIVLIVVVNIFFAKKRLPLSARAHKLESGLTGITVDLMTNIRAVQDYARRRYEMNHIEEKITERQEAGIRNWNFGEWTLVCNGVLQTVFSAGMVLATLYLARAGTISVGDIVLVLTIIFRIDGMLLFLGTHINRLGEVWGEMTESLEEIVEDHEIIDVPGAKPLTIHDASIGFDNVSFSYGGASVFEKLSLHIAPGQRVGLVGRSGAGKSTLVRLLLRHHDLNHGSILVGGENIAQVTQESLRNIISAVPQEPLLFHRSIHDNIAYGNPDASAEEVMHAAKLAHAHDFISKLPEGYESLVGERGVKLSGGERQRIAIARAILKNAPILLLDEATSALDSESEVAIQAALHELMRGKTVIAIAHRLSTLREMDRIIVMDQGKIVEDGSHTELLKQRGVYAKLWNHQAGGFIKE